MESQNREFTVFRFMAVEVRAILQARVRLSFTERRRWPYLMVFSVTGPAAVLDAVEQEIDWVDAQDMGRQW